MRMALGLFLILILSALPLSLSKPLQPQRSRGFQLIETEKSPGEDVLSTIARANKESTKPMRHGDIALNLRRSAIKCESGSCLWPKSPSGLVTIPYALSAAYTTENRIVITAAMLEFETLTCIRFVPRTDEKDYLDIISDSGCWSYLGRTGGVQDLSLQTDGCLVHGVVQHELNHALGFVHEHSRSDRDTYLAVIWDNIQNEYKGLFDKIDTDNLGLEYDYASVMHYGKYAFSVNYLRPSIKPIPDNSIPIGQRYGLSNLDIAKINKLYNCNRCSSVLSDDKGTLFSASNPSNYPNNYNCSWLIRIPSDQVLLQFQAFDVQASQGCAADYVRVYDGPSRRSPLLLDRICGTGQLPLLVSSRNIMLVEFISDLSVSATGFRASYRTVACGGTFISPSGNVSSPGYEKNQLYPAYSNCTWSLIAPAGYQVRLDFVNFSLESSHMCTYDYVEISDGMMATSKRLGPFCGTEKIPTITSTKNALILRFISDDSSESTGFMTKYSIGKFQLSEIWDNSPVVWDIDQGMLVLVDISKDGNMRVRGRCRATYLLCVNDIRLVE